MHTERRSPCVLKWRVTCRRPVIADVIRLPCLALSNCLATDRMPTNFKQLNDGWNAEPNAPHVELMVSGTTLTLAFFANPYLYPEFADGQMIRLQFNDVWRYAVGCVNDEGWFRGQCRFSKLAPSWGEFYDVSGDLRLDEFDAEWHVLTDKPAHNLRHYLFYFRDENFECDAVSWERIQ